MRRFVVVMKGLRAKPDDAATVLTVDVLLPIKAECEEHTIEEATALRDTIDAAINAATVAAKAITG